LAFNDNEVKYLIIGGYAFISIRNAHKDLDLWISTDPKNATAFRALKIFGALCGGLARQIFQKKVTFIKWDTRAGDILMGIPGAILNRLGETGTRSISMA
jgi:hypothetical protein